MNADPLSKLNLITLRKQPQYLIDNVLKFGYNILKNVIVYSTCSTDYHSLNSQWDIFVLVFDTKNMDKIKKYIDSNYTNKLPLYCVIGTDYLLITKAVSMQIYEMAAECTPFAIGGLYIKEMGGILAESDVKVDITYKGAKYPQIFRIHKSNYIHISPNIYGPASLSSWYILRYLIKHNKNKELNIIELGASYGRTTIELLKVAKSNKSVYIYTFDKFLNICQTNYKFNKSNPLCKFLLNVPQYETFCRNVSDHIDESRHVYATKSDVKSSIQLLRSRYIMPDIVFLADKDIKKVETVLTAIFKYAPKVLFVGNNCTDKKVKEGVRQFHSKHKHLHLFTTADCYILSAMPIDAGRIDAYIKKELQNNYMENLVYTLFACKYSDIINMLKKKPVDINMPIDFCNNNTFYTLVVIEIYSKKNKAAIVLQKYILQNIDATPKKIENALFLTYQDYINEYNRGTPIIF
jgi:hypothetical protein